ncbi:hypothetical protein Glove_367g23 [Diversispora epigaea]|uniref:BTB domain-containing protein n=1 Tax=Diversispora epigaea TaxID=1348612 RepID=A0A397H794_9GLOM|nr:hypothetical protein Glove_367g23 [Diversispora epigaea]
MNFKFFDKLSQDFSELLNDKKEYNVVIEVDKEGNMKSFTAHSVVLRYRSSYFDKELENFPTDKNHIKTIIKPNISAPLFEIILKYIYGGIVDIEISDTKTVYELMINANKLEFKELSVKLESYLIESKASWLRTHFSLVYRSIFNSNEFKDLKNFYNNIIVKYPNLIFESEDFTSLQETALISILKRDDLKVEEIKIWDYVIKWGIAQNPTLPTDSKEWSKENFETLKITLKRCLPLIRYFHISGDDILEKVKPYKKILEKQLWGDIIQHSISPNKPITSLVLPARIISNQDFTSLQETALISILKRDDLKVEEIKIWDYVIKWGIAQNPTLPTDSKEWSKENFETLKITLKRCLPLIRYFHISGDDILEKVKPYKKILEKQLWGDIIQHSISPNKPITSLVLPARIISNRELSSRPISTPELPSRTISTPEFPSRTISTPEFPSRTISTPASRTISTPEFPSRVNGPFSIIINEEHVAELSSWIDRKSTTYSLSNIPYEFQLILRGSRDGFQPKTFWNMCHGHAGTIVVVKVAGTDEIVGGYNPMVWDNSASNANVKTNDSFIFSLKNGNIQNSIISRILKNSRALYYYSMKNIYGPAFGISEFMMKSNVSDFTQDELCRCEIDPIFGSHYEKPIRTSNKKFSILDYEVFKIIKK